MKYSAREIAAFVGGQVEGDPNRTATHPAKIEEADENSICFLANLKYQDHLYERRPAIVLVNHDFQHKEEIPTTFIRVDDVYGAVQQLLSMFQNNRVVHSAIDSTSVINGSATIGERVAIGAQSFVGEHSTVGNDSKILPQVYIGNHVTIGNQVTLYPGVRIYDNSVIGDRCIVHANSVIGSDGFGYTPGEEGFKKIPHLGNVVLEEDVEVGANTVIDRAVMGSTVIRKGVKLDNLIQVAHNVEIGAHSGVAAQAGIAGSAKIGKRCLIGGQVGIIGHVQIADGVQIQAKSGIGKTIKEENSKWWGYPALPYYDYLRSYTVFKHLPELRRMVEALRRRDNEKDQ